MISIAYSEAGFQEKVNGVLRQAQNPAGVLMAMGRELGNQLRKHFRMKERTEANKLAPGRRSHFWLQVMRSVNNPEQRGNTVSVTVSDPRFAQKVFGGRITAKRAAMLTIPMSERAYGRTAATFEAETGLKLFLLRTRTGGPARGVFGPSNLERAVLAAKLPGGGIEVEYLLKRSVEQEADATALPERSALEKALIERGQRVADRQTEI